MPELTFVVEEENANIRIDAYLANVSELSRSRIQKEIKDNHVLVDGKAIKSNYKVKENDRISLYYEEEKEMHAEPEKMDLDIVYEDDDLIVINKPKGLVVHPAVGHHEHTLVNGLLYHSKTLSSINGDFRPGIVHRLDKDTSGLIVCAKNDKTHISLSEQLQDKRCFRKYYALLTGVLPYDDGEVDAPIGRDHKDRQKMAIDPLGKDSLTLFHVIKRYAKETLVSCELKTGRTHQIRVHMAYIGYPVENDPKYGKRKADERGQMLHAYYLSFIHPTTQEVMTFETAIPSYFDDYLKENGEC